VAAVITLAVSGTATLVSGGSDSDRTVSAVEIEAIPEGPDFRVSRGDPQWDELSLPARLPKLIPQTCGSGSSVVLTLADTTRLEYGPCKRPPVIELLRADLLSVANHQDLRASVGPACGKDVIADWYDNARVDRLYRRVCYEVAPNLLPEGGDDLGGAEATIRQALCSWARCQEEAAVAEAEKKPLRAAIRAGHSPPTSLGQLCFADAATPPCGSGVSLGSEHQHLLYTHCGIEWTVFDGRLWLTEPPQYDEGVRGAPAGWGDPNQAGIMRLLEEQRAEFRAGSLVATFVPAPPGYERDACD
jgi:hypothetical protein